MTVDLQPVEILGDTVRQLDTEMTPIVGNIVIWRLEELMQPLPDGGNLRSLEHVAELRFTSWSFELDCSYTGPALMRVRSAGWEPIERRLTIKAGFPQEIRMFRDIGFDPSVLQEFAR